MKKFLLSVLSIVMLAGLVLPASAHQEVTSISVAPTSSQVEHYSYNDLQYHPELLEEDEYDRLLDEAVEVNAQEETGTREKRRVKVFKKLVEIVIKEVYKLNRSFTVRATDKEVVTKLSQHAIKKAYDLKFTGQMIDDVLAEKPKGIFVIQKFDDALHNSRVMYDRHNGVAVVIGKYSNEIITVYKSTQSHIDRRMKEGRWQLGNWNFE
jgi:hypothetical protein